MSEAHPPIFFVCFHCLQTLLRAAMPIILKVGARAGQMAVAVAAVTKIAAPAKNFSLLVIVVRFKC